MACRVLHSILAILLVAFNAGAEWEIIHIGSPGARMMLLGADIGDGNNDGANEIYASALPQMVTENNKTKSFFIGFQPWQSVTGNGGTGGDSIWTDDPTLMVYQFKYEAGSWIITGLNSVPTNDWLWDVRAGDGDNDGNNEVYGSVAIGPSLGLNQFRWNGITWNRVSMGHGGELSVDLGDGDNNNLNEIYGIPTNDTKLYRFHWNGINWVTGDLGEILPSLHPLSLAVGDGDNDGLEEVYAAFQYQGIPIYELHQFVWNESAWVHTRIDSGIDFHALGLAVGDGNNDGQNEIYTTTYSGGIYQYKWVNSEWQRTLVYDEGHELIRVAVGDGDNNGSSEIYVADYGTPPTGGGHVFMYEWDGFSWHRTDIGLITVGGVTGSVNDVAVGDANNDGREEVYCSMSSSIFMCAMTDTISVSLTPHNPPIQIPASGGSFVFDARIENATNYPITFDAWTEVILPNGQTFPRPFVLRTNLSVQGSQTIMRTVTQFVPPYAPTGNYTYVGNAGTYPGAVAASDSFPFEKLAGDAAPNHNQGWSCYGWFDDEISSSHPLEFTLHPAYPNPFNPVTTLSFSLPEASRASLKIYDIAGRLTATLMDGWRDSGTHEITFDGSDLASGLYIYQIQAGASKASGKMLLIK